MGRGATRMGGWILGLWGCLALRAVDAAEVPLAFPLSTIIAAPQRLPLDAGAIQAEVEIGADAPVDLRLALWVRTDDGVFFEAPTVGHLAPGTHQLSADLAGAWSAEPVGERWSPYQRSRVVGYGVVASAASGAQHGLRLRHLVALPGEAPPPAALGSLRELQVADMAPDGAHGACGERWSCSVVPAPAPTNPYDADEFCLDAEVTLPDGGHLTIPGFYDQPMRLMDRGDREVTRGAGGGRFCVRFRPWLPGRHHLQLLARWGSATRSLPLPDLVVAGPACDAIVHVDRTDPRFFSREGAFCWPVGLNLASPRDDGATRDLRYGIRPTPDRGSFAYDAYFARLAAAGGDAAEIWLSTWNLGLEWQAGWTGYHGIGRYNEGNAARLDRVLDDAWAHGVRLVLNLNNHGQVLAHSGESEWQWNPINSANGGWISDPQEIFSDPRALRAQDQLRRYLAARYADHPAVLVWKLWSEVDLTQLGCATIRAWRQPTGLAQWHRRACDDWHRLDSYHHPVATHVATTYQNAHPGLVSIPELDAIGLDAYFQPGVYTSAESLFGLMRDTMLDPGDGWRVSGCARWRKPVFVTEYGGGWREANKATLAAEHRSGAWLALVTGEAAAPMLWWHEWVDQTDAWAPYHAIRAFLQGEDLRGEAGESVSLVCEGGEECWAQAWRRPGRMLVYLQDATWGRTAKASLHQGGALELSPSAGPGRMHVQWWDADRGIVTAESVLTHAGGRLLVPIPDFRGQIALKVWRLPPALVPDPGTGNGRSSAVH